METSHVAHKFSFNFHFLCHIHFVKKKIDGNSWENQHGKKAFKEISISINS